MNTVDRVKQCRTPQEALLVLAAAIDELAAEAQPADPWEQPLEWGEALVPVRVGTQMPFNEPPAAPDNRAIVEGDDVIVKPVSLERQLLREEFADNARLSEFYGPGLSPEHFIEAYVKGGPRWLYYTNRPAVMAMPVNLRHALVEDVLLDSPEEADEIGRDILKFEFDEGTREGESLDALRRLSK